MVTNTHGDTLIINSKGETMGKKEFQNTGGGNLRLMSNYNKKKEQEQLSASTLVTFEAHPTQKYGLDQYNDLKKSVERHYPTLKNNHQPAFKSIASRDYDKVRVNNT